jgi:hypothetical protein
MTPAGPQIRSSNLWNTREAKCLSIIERALQLLSAEIALPVPEIELNRRFYFCLLMASRDLYPEDDIAPVTECNNQPDPDDEVRVKREQKRPDFQWAYLDRYEPDPQRSSRQFVLECKRLGTATRADWILNLNYINHGIARFREPEWAYGKLVSSGAMVGYWQTMEPDAVLAEVNTECGAKVFANLKPIGSWVLGGTSRFEHLVDRSFEISPFRLHHFWIDLRA